MSDFVSVDLSRAQLYYGTIYQDGAILPPPGVTPYMDFSPVEIFLDHGTFYEFRVEATYVDTSAGGGYIDAYSLDAAGMGTEHWWYLGEGTVADWALGTACTFLWRVGPGCRDWDQNINPTQPRVVFDTLGLRITRVQWRVVNDLNAAVGSDGKLAIEWGAPLAVNLLPGAGSKFDGSSSFGTRVVAISDSVAVVCLESGDYERYYALRCNGDGSVEVGPTVDFFASQTYGGDTHLDPVVPDGNIGRSYVSDVVDLLPVPGGFVHLGNPDLLANGRAYFASVYQVNDDLTVTRTSVFDRAASASDAYYWNAAVCKWRDDRFVIANGGYAAALPSIIVGSIASGFLSSTPAPHTSSYGRCATVGDTLVYVSNRFDVYGDNGKIPLMVNIYGISEGGTLAHRAELSTMGLGGNAGGEFPVVTATTVGTKVLITGCAPTDTNIASGGNTYQGRLLGAWIDPDALTISDPFPIGIGKYIEAQAGRTGIYSSALVRVRDGVALPDGETAWITYATGQYDEITNIKIAQVREGQPVVTINVVGPPLDGRTSVVWSWVQTAILSPTRLVNLTLGPLYDARYGARLVVGNRPGSIVGGPLAAARNFLA